MRSEIQNVFTVTPMKDDPPKGEINVVGSIGGEKTIILNKSFDLCMQICFEVRGRNLDSRIVNSLLRKFRKQLEDYRLKDGKTKAWPKRVDEFQHELVGTDLAICSQHILWGIFSLKGVGDAGIQVRLLRDMRIQNLVEAEISIQMTDAVFQGSHRHGRWPRDRFDGAGF